MKGIDVHLWLAIWYYVDRMFAEHMQLVADLADQCPRGAEFRWSPRQ